MYLDLENCWKFAIGDRVQHRNGSVYNILNMATLEWDGTPVYVYGSDTHTWVRPKAEMEDGRFKVVEWEPDAD